MAIRRPDAVIPDERTTTFPAGGRASRAARLLVVDMVLWSGVLFIGVSLFAAWRMRGDLLILAAWLIATAFSVAVGAHQGRVMLRSVFGVSSERAAPVQLDTEEVSPRLTGRGGTGPAR